MSNKIVARTLLTNTTHDLWTLLKGKFTLIFDDGEIETNWKETVYSSYVWDMHRQYPETPLLKAHHVSRILKGRQLGSSTHLKLFSVVGEAVFAAYQHNGTVSMDMIAKLIYQRSNAMYNELSWRLETSVTSIDITDFIEILEHPDVKEIIDNVGITQESIGHCYDAITKLVNDPQKLIHNTVVRAAQAGLIKHDQLLQCVGPRAFVTDIDSTQFPIPIQRGYVKGIRSLYGSMIESRSSAKSLYFSKSPLQQAEWFSRRLQILCQVVRNLHHGDCGSTHYLHWKVRPSIKENGKTVFSGDLPNLVGKYYMCDTDHVLKMVRSEDKHLEGTTLKIRSHIAGCMHPDPYGICSTCFGGLANNIPPNSNIGHVCCTHMTQKISQSVLSVKHLDVNAVIEMIVLNDDMKRYVRVSQDGNSYALSESMKGKKLRIIIPSQCAIGLTDIAIVKDVHDLSISRVSEIPGFTLEVTHQNGVEEKIFINTSINKRYASMTYQMLDHLKKNGWEVDERSNFVVNMEGWNFANNLMSLPLRHFNMSDYSDDIASMIEARVSDLKERDKDSSPEATLFELCDTVNSKLSINLAVIETTLYGAMIVSAEDGDFRLPKPWTKKGLGVSGITIHRRSLSGSMAYEDHVKTMTSPVSFFQENRPSHPMDVFLCPKEVIESLDRKTSGYVHPSPNQRAISRGARSASKVKNMFK